MNATPRLALPLIAPGQTQKELFHNESLQILDAVVSGAVELPPLSTPPAAPLVGACYIVGSSPTGEWSGHTNQLASFTIGGWRFIAPKDGISVLVRDSGLNAIYRDGEWSVGTVACSQVAVEGKKVLGSRGIAISSPAGGSTVDTEARVAIGQILVAMREHGLIEI